MSKLYDPIEDMETIEFENGLQVLIIPMKSNATIIEAVVQVGAQDDPLGKEGLSHFLEHRMTGEYGVPLSEITKQFREVGGAFNAGATGWVDTEYGVRIPLGETRTKFITWFANFMMNNPLEQNIEDERTIILREYDRDYDSQIHERSIHTRKKLLWGPSHVITRASSPLGTKTSIGNINLSDLRSHYAQYYTPQNMTLVVITGENPAVVINDLANSAFADTRTGVDRNRAIAPQPALPRGVRHHTFRFHEGAPHSYDAEWAFTTPSVNTLPLHQDMSLSLGSEVLEQILFDEVREKRQLSYAPKHRQGNLRINHSWTISCDGLREEDIPKTFDTFRLVLEMTQEHKEKWIKARDNRIAQIQTTDWNPSNTLSRILSTIPKSATSVTVTDTIRLLTEEASFEDFVSISEKWLDPENRLEEITPN